MRPIARFPTGWLLMVLLLAMSVDASGEEKIISIDEIEPGMKGYGLTVFEGTQPEKFDVEVISVVPNFLLRQSIILIRVSHPVTDHSGIIGGMSGSPIYIEGRLAGALAYGWRFHKDPVAGVTPIENMLAVLDRKVRPEGRKILPMGLARAMEPLLRDSSQHKSLPAGPFFDSFAKHSEAHILPARTPLTISGFAGKAESMLEEALSPFGMDPVMGGGSGGVKDPGKFVPGGALGVQLVRGDMNATGIGTVTTVRGDDVLAFGHPMTNMGQAFFPVTTARIHTVIASINRSNKLGSPLGAIGSLVQDRQACIAARTDRTAPMIPVTFNIKDPRGGIDERYRVEMISHRQMTPRILHAVLINIIQSAASDSEDMTAEITGRIEVSGRAPITLLDAGASRSGLAPLAAYFRPAGIVAAILSNPFEDATVESIDFDITLHYGLELTTIVGAFLTAENPQPGDKVNLNVMLRSYGGDESILALPIEIPESSADSKLVITVGGGDSMAPIMPIPRNLDDMLTNVKRFYPPRSIVVVTEIPGEGITMRGRVLEQLPDFAVSALKPAAGAQEMTSHKTSLRMVYPTSHLVVGKQTVSVTVGSRKFR